MLTAQLRYENVFTTLTYWVSHKYAFHQPSATWITRRGETTRLHLNDFKFCFDQVGCHHIIIHTGFSTKKSSTSVDESEKKSTVKQLNQLNFCPTFAGNSLDQVKILRLKSFSVLSCFLNYPHEILRLISIIMMT